MADHQQQPVESIVFDVKVAIHVDLPVESVPVVVESGTEVGRCSFDRSMTSDPLTVRGRIDFHRHNWARVSRDCLANGGLRVVLDCKSKVEPRVWRVGLVPTPALAVPKVQHVAVEHPAALPASPSAWTASGNFTFLGEPLGQVSGAVAAQLAHIVSLVQLGTLSLQDARAQARAILNPPPPNPADYDTLSAYDAAVLVAYGKVPQPINPTWWTHGPAPEMTAAAAKPAKPKPAAEPKQPPGYRAIDVD